MYKKWKNDAKIEEKYEKIKKYQDVICKKQKWV